MMHYTQWIAFMLGILSLGAVVVGNGLSFKVQGYRTHQGRLNGFNQQRITRLSAQANPRGAVNARNLALAFTTSHLEFSMDSDRERDPNRIIQYRRAHCIMYSYVYASTYNHLATDGSVCRVAYGQFYLYG